MALSKSDALYDQLRADILSLALEPNAPLRLPALSERYGVGLTPLRECLTRLSSDRLVVPEHNKGFHVAPLTRTDLLDLERSRGSVEGEMFAWSVQNGGDTWEAGVVGTYHHLSRTTVPHATLDEDAVQLWVQRHRAFHRALVSGSPSVWMHRFARQMEDQLGRYHRFIRTGLRELIDTAPHVAAQATGVFATAMALEPHRLLYDVALARDPVAARTAIDVHTGLTIAAFENLTALIPRDSVIAKTLGIQKENRL